MSRFLLEPCNNTLSHVAKCLALREVLEARGHEVFLAVSSARARFLERLGERAYFVLPDIQEADGRSLPGFAWFRPARVEACVRAELDLLRRLRPDVVLGVFRFTGPLSAALAGVPYDSLICGCMTPACPEVLGFTPGEPGAGEQEAALRFFRQTCARRMRPVFTALGLDLVADIWELLVGRRTFLWDFPEFQPLPPVSGYRHVGPMRWSGWPRPERGAERLAALRDPLAYVSFGTGRVPPALIRQIVGMLRQMGYSVALAMGGQSAAPELPPSPGEFAAFEFLPVELALARAALVVCHGGQGLVFEAMRQAIPLLVLPLQPEQAQNGLCIERLGCGRRLLKGVVFDGDPRAGMDAILCRSPEDLAEEGTHFLRQELDTGHLARAAGIVRGYDGVAALARGLEEGA